MPFDPRLYGHHGSYSPASSSGEADIIEMRPWTPNHPESFNDRHQTYQSTEELLPIEHLRLSQLSPTTYPSLNSLQDSKALNSWKFGVFLCLLLALAVLVLNITVTVWAALTFGLSGGIGTIHKGSCPSMKRTGFWLHVAINVISTALLGASNYCMQCLCSPTRVDLDRAHARNDWLDIGIQSVRNLFRIRRLRVLLWLLLAASSVPLHLMFNSALFVSLTANEYTVAVVNVDFVQGGNWSFVGTDQFHRSLITEMQRNVSLYERLDPPECVKAYGVDYLSSWRHVLVIVTDPHPTNPIIGILDWNYTTAQNSWVCGTIRTNDTNLEPLSILDFDCNIPTALESISNATLLMDNYLVEYCLAQKVEDQCRLQFAVPIMAVVICCNFMKLLCMAATLWRCREASLITLGDALNSFLQKPDLSTVGLCTATKQDFEGYTWPSPKPRRWVAHRDFRFQAVGIWRWVLSNMICAVAVISLSILLRVAIHNTSTASDIKTLYSLGFGAVSSSSIIRWKTPLFGSSGLLKNVLLANSPQLILSLLYILYNRVYTSMSFSKEWNDFAYVCRCLRVTSPKGAQRSTYFLSLPYKYLGPILAVSISTHWILSQSLFLVSIDVYDEEGNLDTSQSILTCGFSSIALVFLIGIGWLVLIAGVGMGLRRYKSGMPLVGSCSAAISAACHPPADETDTALVPVKWGVIGIEKGIGHCSLSGRYVSPPIPWRLYQGELLK